MELSSSWFVGNISRIHRKCTVWKGLILGPLCSMGVWFFVPSKIYSTIIGDDELNIENWDNQVLTILSDIVFVIHSSVPTPWTSIKKGYKYQ